MAVMQGTVQGQGAFPVQGLNAVQSAGVSGGSSPGVFDPNFANVKALLHFDAANGSQIYTDQIGHVFTPGGGLPVSRLISTAAPKFGAGSLVGTAADSKFVSCPSSTDFATNGAYTMESWARADSLVGNGVLWSIVSGASTCAVFWNFTTGALTFYDGSSHALGVNIAADGVYRHIAVSSQGPASPINVFVNGATVYTGVAVAGGATNQLLMGFDSSLGVSGFQGALDEVRFTKGVSRYNAPFTPPTAPFPNS